MKYSYLAISISLCFIVTSQTTASEFESSAVGTALTASTTVTTQAATDCSSDALCSVWVNKHNELRQSLNSGGVTDDGIDGNYPVPTTPLPNVEWNTTLAQVAQNHADKCEFEHNSNSQSDYVALGGENIYIGENIAAHWFYSPAGVKAYYADLQMQMWWDEHTDWHYQIINYSNINSSGHFTQMIWANTVEIGCGMARCENFSGSSYDAYFSVCNYGPGGNYVGQYPYSTN